MIHKVFFQLLLSLLCTQILSAQEIHLSELSIEQLSEQESFEQDDDAAIQQYEYLKKDPLDINTAQKEDLQIFSFLTDLHIHHLLLYRKINGDFISIYELQAIPYWDESIIRQILPYVFVGNRAYRKQQWKAAWSQGRHLLLAGTTYKWYQDGQSILQMDQYPGSRERSFVRYKYQYKNMLQYGIVADKDAGEAWFKGVQKQGFDFYSVHAMARNLGKIKTLVLGDYTVNLGQGLLCWQSMAFKKSAEVMMIKRQSAVLRPYHSAGEYLFQRGLGITMAHKAWSLTSFASIRNLTSKIYFDSIGKYSYFSSVNSSGLHRTQSEQKNKAALQLITAGGNISYDLSRLHIGMNLMHYDFGNVRQQKEAAPYNLFSFRGNRYTNMSTDASYTFRNMHWFAELAQHQFRSSAFIGGLMMSLDPKVDLALLYRNMSPAYHAQFGNAFTESTFPSNEKGLYAGLTLRPKHQWKIDAYADLFMFPWLRYTADAPSIGREYMIQVMYAIRRQGQLYFRVRDELKMNNEPSSSTNFKEGVRSERKINCRVQLDLNYNKSVTVRNRIEMLNLHQAGALKQSGFLCFLDLLYKPMMKPYAFNMRLQYFEADSYDSRIYAYENDVMYQFSIPAFYGQGYRGYINGRLKMGKNWNIWMRLSRLWKEEGNDFEIKFQAQRTW
ncbi:MAG: helix-hairpin-helix domain-containing protein [Bacteroidota bacterium]